MPGNPEVTASQPGARALDAYDRQPARDPQAHTVLIESMRGLAEPAWLDCAQQLVLRRDKPAALALLTAAAGEHPDSCALRVALAGMLLETGDMEQAESLLRTTLASAPRNLPAGFLLARMLRDQGRMQAVGSVILALFPAGLHDDPEAVMAAIDLLSECDRQAEAATLCESQISHGSLDPRMHVYSAMLLAQLGQFALARERYAFVLAHSSLAFEWQVPLGLSGLQRYSDESHVDFSLFREGLRRHDLSHSARTALLFAAGKAYDDIHDHARAALYLHQANEIVQADLTWSRKRWMRSIDARVRRQPPTTQLPAASDWSPLFIVGLPRSGTTLLAELLARHPQVCNRGELPWLPTLVERIYGGNGDQLRQVAASYMSRLRQDDSHAYWFIDKQPHNFMHVDLIVAMFPQARIIYCERHARDNALSLWMQSFQPGTQDFAYDFADIGAVIRGSRRLMRHWMTRYPDAIRTIRYEQLTANPEACLRTLSTWLGLPAHDMLAAPDALQPISTASLWQARQPIHTRSVQRWRNYASAVPKLMELPDD